jgi:hypothetical protein
MTSCTLVANETLTKHLQAIERVGSSISRT